MALNLIFTGPPDALRNRDLSGLDLGTVNLTRMDLTGTNFSRCKFGTESKFPAGMKNVNFNRASFKNADFAGVTLGECNFSRVFFNGKPNFNGAKMLGGTFEMANGLKEGTFLGASLDRVWAQGALPEGVKVANKPMVRPEQYREASVASPRRSVHPSLRKTAAAGKF